MDRAPSQRPLERHPDQNSQPPTPATYAQPFPPPTAQPPVQFPFSDPFQANRDPFLPAPHGLRDSIGPARAWPPSQGHTGPNGHPQRTSPQQQSRPLPPPPPSNGIAQMSLPYDPSRRRSLGASGSPLPHPQGPLEPPPPPPPFQPRHMPPPSPPQMPSSASSLPGSAPRGPPIASPFAGVRDLASYSSHRPAGGMSISSILGGNEEKKSHGSPLSSTPKSMPPPSPGRARSSSMRDGLMRGARDVSPPRSIFQEPKTASAALGHDRTASEPRREGLFASPQFLREPVNNFRAFHPSEQEPRPGLNGHGPPGRPSSQPTEPAGPRRVEEIVQHDAPADGRIVGFRPFAEPHGSPLQSEATQRRLLGMSQNGHGPAPQPAEHAVFSSPQADRDRAQHVPLRFQPGAFGTPMREEQAGLFRPAFQPASEPARESIETRQFHDIRRDLPRSSPPLSEHPPFDRGRNSFIGGPVGLEDYRREMVQREAMQREQQRKESDGSLHRALLNNISPDVNRKGRNSPLPQAVQGAQPRHVGPGGDNPSVKMEFGRMFSGLGSGVGAATPTPGHANGTVTPSRMTPVRQVEGGDLVRTAVAEIEEGRRSSKADSRGGKKDGRRFREDEERLNGRETPEYQRGTKRAKTDQATHHHHHHVHPHHHHHHHQPVENTMPNPFNTIRFQSNPLSNSNLLANPAHHHHHHASHSHPGHHHHHAARPAPPPRKPTTTVMSKRLVEDCAKKPRKHLGSQLYTTELSLPPAADTPIDAKIKFSSKMKPIPFFEGKENCTFTVRVPRWYLAFGHDSEEGTSYLEEICKRRQLWGTDVYTDDSDVVAAAVHSGWLKGDFGDFNEDLHSLCANDSEREDENESVPLTLTTRPRRPVRAPEGHDAHITLLILPPLESYASSNQHHILSREWSGRGVVHDGMSFMIERIEFVDEGLESRSTERSAEGRKWRLAVEERRRREAARVLVLFAGGGGGEKVVPVGA